MKHITLVALIASTPCFADPYQHVATTAVNSGSIHNTVSVSTSVVGSGYSVSGAYSQASALSTGTAFGVPVSTASAYSGSVGISGQVSTSASGYAFNYSTGNGTGSAFTNGSADGWVTTSASYAGPGQSVFMNGNTQAHSGYTINATQNTGSFAENATTASYTGAGQVGSTSGAGSVSLTGSVSDTKSASAVSSVGTLTVTGIPTNAISNASVQGNASSVTNVTGSFIDPVGGQ